MQLFTIAFEHPIEFGISTAVVVAMIFAFVRSAMTAESRSTGWVRAITGPNGKVFFGLLFVVWSLVFGIGLQLVPHEGSSSPYGGLAFIALMSGFFIMMGFLWSVIGE